VISKQSPELPGVQEVCFSRFVLEGDEPLIGIGVKTTVPDEVEDVPGTYTHRPL